FWLVPLLTGARVLGRGGTGRGATARSPSRPSLPACCPSRARRRARPRGAPLATTRTGVTGATGTATGPSAAPPRLLPLPPLPLPLPRRRPCRPWSPTGRCVWSTPSGSIPPSPTRFASPAPHPTRPALRNQLWPAADGDGRSTGDGGVERDQHGVDG